MARLPQTFVEDVVARSDIAEVVAQYVRLQPKGKRLWGLCPFHAEKTPSFSVNPQEQFFYCFGCHKGGDVVTFVRELEKLEYTEAIIRLAERLNMSIPETTGERHSITREKREKAYAACKAAARWFHKQLFEPEGAAALAYLRRRGVTDRYIKRFGLGFAPDRWRGLEEALRPEGVEREALLDTALLLKKDDNVYNAFRGRLMFPILDIRRRVVGFGGRVLDGSEPKYLNSPDTIIYNKRRMLYGAHLLTGKGAVPYVILTEGYMDTISLHQAGMNTAVASCGTALTPEQAQLISRFSKDVYLAYDGDASGINASLRSLDILEEKDLRVRVMSFPDGKDPDDVARSMGIDGLELSRNNAEDSVTYRLKRLADGVNMEDAVARSRYAQECCRQVLAKIPSPVEHNRAVRILHLSTGIPEVDILAESQRWRGKSEHDIAKSAVLYKSAQETQSGAGEQGAVSEQNENIRNARRFLAGMLTLGEKAAHCWPAVGKNDFAGYGLDTISECMRQHPDADTRRLMSLLPGDDQATLSRIIEEASGVAWTTELLAGYLRKLVMIRYRKQLDDITRELAACENERKTVLKAQLVETSKVLRNLRDDWDLPGLLEYLTHCNALKEGEQLEHN